MKLFIGDIDSKISVRMQNFACFCWLLSYFTDIL